MERTPLFYLANLGSEVNRIFVLKGGKFDNEAKSAYARSMSIIEKLLNHPDLIGRTQEIEMLKNYLEESFKNNDPSSAGKEWQNYFMPYATKQLSVS